MGSWSPWATVALDTGDRITFSQIQSSKITGCKTEREANAQALAVAKAWIDRGLYDRLKYKQWRPCWGEIASLIGQLIFKYPGEFSGYEHEAREQRRVLSLCREHRQKTSGIH